MRDKLQFKITLMMTALVTAVLLVAGLLLMGHTALSHYRSFDAWARRAFDESTLQQLTASFSEKKQPSSLLPAIQKGRAMWEVSDHLHFTLLREDTVVFTDGDGGSVPQSAALRSVRRGEKSGINPLFGTLPTFAVALDETHIFYVWDDGSSLFARLREIGVLLLPVLAIAWVLAAVLSFILARTITRPILRLTGRAEALAKGAALSPAEAYRKDEIGSLDRTFDEMAAKLQQTIARLTLMIDQMPMPICAMSEGKILHQNSLFAALPSLPLEIQPGCGRVTIDKKEYDWQISSFYDNGYLIVLQDITPFTELDRARRSFVADVSHEMKTPLTVLRTYTETLADPAPVERELQQKFLQTMLSECDRMDHMIGQLLTLSRLESQTEAVNERIDLVPLTRRITDAFSLSMAQKGQTLSLSLCDSAPVYLTEEEAERIITNLLSNALRYGGEKGEISLSLQYDGKRATLVVEDNGIGIAEEHLSRIFDKFYRVDTARARATGGTGLGLSIVKETLEKRGGFVQVESKLGEFTRFTVKI